MSVMHVYVCCLKFTDAILHGVIQHGNYLTVCVVLREGVRTPDKTISCNGKENKNMLSALHNSTSLFCPTPSENPPTRL